MGPDPRGTSARALRRVLHRLGPELASCLTPYADLRNAFTVRVPCVAEWLVEPGSQTQLHRIWQALREEGVGVRLLGGGSNTVPVHPFLTGITLTLRRLRGVRREGGDGELLGVAAGTPLQTLVRAAQEAGLGGVEGLAGIPGSVGGALVMNAGGRHGCIGDVVEDVEVLEADGQRRRLGPDRLRFGYRQSSLTGCVVVEARLRLAPRDSRELRARRRELIQAKARGQPLDQPSAGCFFQNPPGGSAGQLLDQAGLKGSRIGGALCSPRHANFLVNAGGATGADFAALAERLRSQVAAQCGQELNREVKLWH